MASTIFVYNIAGQVVSEYTTSSEPRTEQTNYLTTDTVASTRLITGQDQSVKARHDYLPFGEELEAGVGGRTTNQAFSQPDLVRQRFSSKELDYETGLYFFGARYYSNVLGRFTGVDPIMLTAERLLDPQRLNLYGYCRDNPLKYIDPDGEDLILANAVARARYRQVIAPGLSRAERRNITRSGNKVRLRKSNAISPQNASPAYRYLSQLISDPDRTVYYYAITQGQTLTTASGQTVTYKDIVEMGGATLGERGSSVLDVIVPVGGSAPVPGIPAGSGITTPNPEDVIFAHEAYGHGLDNDAIQVENEYRNSRHPALPPRSGEDHDLPVNITEPPELLRTPATPPATHLIVRPPIPLLPPPQEPQQ